MPRKATRTAAAACTALLLCAALTHGCAQPQPAAQAQAPDTADDAADADGIGGATAQAAAARWLGKAVLQLISNTRIDIKVDGQSTTQQAP